MTTYKVWTGPVDARRCFERLVSCGFVNPVMGAEHVLFDSCAKLDYGPTHCALLDDLEIALGRVVSMRDLKRA